jgi:uncharacterized protein
MMPAFTRPLLFLVLSLLLARGAVAEIPEGGPQDNSLRVLYVTSVGWFHDYQRQTELITSSVSRHLNASFDVIVGDIPRLMEPDFATGYDVLVYNFCHASRRDPDLVENLMRPVTEQGIPLLAVHCAMHSFQHVDAWHNFLGLKTLRHEDLRSFTLERGSTHPTTEGLRFPWVLESDELYINMTVSSESQSLIKAWGVETKRDHLQAWLYKVQGTPLLATTLGHSEETLSDPQFGEFIARSIAYLAGKLGEDGEISAEVACDDACSPRVRTLTENVRYPTDLERACVLKVLFASSDPWPAPEDLWPACLGVKEVPADR